MSRGEDAIVAARRCATPLRRLTRYGFPKVSYGKIGTVSLCVLESIFIEPQNNEREVKEHHEAYILKKS